MADGWRGVGRVDCCRAFFFLSPIHRAQPLSGPATERVSRDFGTGRDSNAAHPGWFSQAAVKLQVKQQTTRRCTRKDFCPRQTTKKERNIYKKQHKKRTSCVHLPMQSHPLCFTLSAVPPSLSPCREGERRQGDRRARSRTAWIAEILVASAA